MQQHGSQYPDPVPLEANRYNRQAAPHAPKWKRWRSAGLMLTYRCPARCACCYVFSGPEAGSSETEMTTELALTAWRGIRGLAGNAGRVHLTGGEPFLAWERMVALLEAAGREPMALLPDGLEKIETNAHWCTDDTVTGQRLARLTELGLRKLQVSTDIYHQHDVPIDRVHRAIRIAGELLGEEGVQVRWRDFAASPVLVGEMTAAERAQAFREAMSRRPERLVGRAAEQLAPLREQHPWESFDNDPCHKRLMGAAHIHIDGGGTIFPGTCVGIRLGVLREPGQPQARPLEVIWRDLDWRERPLLAMLIRQGPGGLVRHYGKPLGFTPRAGYAHRCQLCYEVRRFLFQQNTFPEELGPRYCYGL